MFGSPSVSSGYRVSLGEWKDVVQENAVLEHIRLATVNLETLI